MPAGVGLEVLVAFILVGALVGAVFAGRRLREIPMPEVRGRRVDLPSRVRALGEQERPSDADWRWLERGLIRAGAGPVAAREVVTRVHERHEPPEDPRALLVDEVAAMFEGDPGLRLPPLRPAVVLVACGAGPGRSVSARTIGKLAHRLVTQGRSVAVATAEAGRGKELAEWSRRAGADPIDGGDPGSRIAAAVKEARGRDVLILDAGRAPRGAHLRRASAEIRRTVEVAAGRPPDAVVLAVNATAALHGLLQVREMAEAAGATGLLLTEVDLASTRAVPLSIREALGLPVWFLATGEGIDDLEAFEPRAYAASLLR